MLEYENNCEEKNLLCRVSELGNKKSRQVLKHDQGKKQGSLFLHKEMQRALLQGTREVRMKPIRLEKLTTSNFEDYESLTKCEGSGGCYCSFWHQKWTSFKDWEKCQKETPEYNRNIILEKVKSNFHVGVLAYSGDELVAWISVGPLIDFYWTWKRIAHVGEKAKSVAGIMCITIAPKFRGQGVQSQLLEALKIYGKEQTWERIEGYPFDASAVEKHKDQVRWPGLEKGFSEAGFTRTEPHWLSNADAQRSIFCAEL